MSFIVPSGMTQDEVFELIEVVINRIAPKYTFHGYTVNDIKQESFIICMDAMGRYDAKKTRLENFLSVNLSNRLKNFIRDNYYTANDPIRRINVIRPAQLENEHTLEEYYIDDEGYSLDMRNMIDVINRDLPPSMRMDYLKMINDVYIPSSRKEDIILTIKEILEDNGFYEEG